MTTYMEHNCKLENNAYLELFLDFAYDLKRKRLHIWPVSTAAAVPWN